MHVDFYYSNLRFPERNAAPSKRPTFLFSSCGLFCFLCAVAPPLIITHVLRSRRAVSRNSSGNTHQCLRCRRFLLQFVYLSLSPPSHRSSAFLLISDLYFFCSLLAILQKLHCSHKFIQFSSIGAVERECVHQNMWHDLLTIKYVQLMWCNLNG